MAELRGVALRRRAVALVREGRLAALVLVRVTLSGTRTTKDSRASLARDRAARGRSSRSARGRDDARDERGHEDCATDGRTPADHPAPRQPWAGFQELALLELRQNFLDAADVNRLVEP